MQTKEEYKRQVAAERSRQWYSDNTERAKENVKQYRLENIKKINNYDRQRRNTFHGRCQLWKINAKKRGIEWNLTEQYLSSLPQVCHYSGVPLTSKANGYYTISLDRLDSSKGYVIGNVAFCCQFINYMKQELSYAQFICACKMIGNHADMKKASTN